jgi:hypothetical protein
MTLRANNGTLGADLPYRILLGRLKERASSRHGSRCCSSGRPSCPRSGKPSADLPDSSTRNRLERHGFSQSSVTHAEPAVGGVCHSRSRLDCVYGILQLICVAEIVKERLAKLGVGRRCKLSAEANGACSRASCGGSYHSCSRESSARTAATSVPPPGCFRACSSARGADTARSSGAASRRGPTGGKRMQSPRAPNLSALGWLARLRWDLPSEPLYPRVGRARPAPKSLQRTVSRACPTENAEGRPERAVPRPQGRRGRPHR